MRSNDDFEPILEKNFIGYASGTSVMLRDRIREDQQRKITMQKMKTKLKSTDPSVATKLKDYYDDA